MFDLGWDEMALIAVVAVIILGPKELPRAMRTAGQWMRKARSLTGDFQRHMDDMIREADLDDLKKEAQKLSRTDIGREIDKTVDPDGSMGKKLRFDDLNDPTGPAAKPKTTEPGTTEAPAAETPVVTDGRAGDGPEKP